MRRRSLHSARITPPQWRVRTSRPAEAWCQAAGSCDELLLDPPRRFGMGRSLVGVCYLRVDLVRVIPVVTDRRADPAGVDHEYLRSGVDRGGAPLNAGMTRRREGRPARP